MMVSIEVEGEAGATKMEADGMEEEVPFHHSVEVELACPGQWVIMAQCFRSLWVIWSIICPWT